jgi:O-antigen ligase
VGLYIIGFFGGILEALGITFISNAFARGPIGPVTALAYLSNPILAVLVCIKTLIFPNQLQILALFLSMIGTLILTVPDYMIKIAKSTLCCYSRQ